MTSSHVVSTLSESSEATGRNIVDATQLCTDLAYQTVLLEKQLSGDQAGTFGAFSAPQPAEGSHPSSDIATMQVILRQSAPWLASAVQNTNDETKQAGIKVVQAVEKFRGLVIQAKSLDLGDTITRALTQLLDDVVTCFSSALEQVGSRLPSLRSEILLEFTVWRRRVPLCCP